ncbi:MAG: hypothetical protein ACRDYC_04935, partial [Acidimicrobiales bacterium]
MVEPGDPSSFCQQIFLGRFRLELIDSLPEPSEDERRLGRGVAERLGTFLHDAVDPAEIERDAE